MLILMAAAAALSFSTWRALLNNFAVGEVSFTGTEMGMLQSLRELPGFLAFTVVFLLPLLREQRLALFSLAILGVGTALTGLSPTVWALYGTTLIMSIGFHYNETVQQSLALQWAGKERAPVVLGRIIAGASAASLAAYALIWVAFEVADLGFEFVYIAGGGITLVLVVYVWAVFPLFPQQVEQHKTLVLRRRYWLYYAIVFFSGARRQIFMVFAGFMMVERFGFTVGNITFLFLANHAVNIWLAPAMGRLITRWGERRSLSLEYGGLVVVFTAYAYVDDMYVAAGLYVVDHLLFAMAIAAKTYFHKIADPKDIAPTAAVAFTINHVAAVVLPLGLGIVWIESPRAVFLVGTGFALGSLLLSRLIPRHPSRGCETVLRATVA
ncbi:MAG: MFS transporter [Nannocystaceae bacterium]